MKQLAAGLVALLAVPLMLALVLLALLAAVADYLNPFDGAASGGLTPEARRIPVEYLAAYRAAGARHGVDWEVIAGIGHVETRHGRYLGPTGVLHDGCIWGPPTPYGYAKGPMQFLDSSWRLFGEDGNGDGTANACDYRDAPYGTARHLKEAPWRRAGEPIDYERSVYAYNHSTQYVADVLGMAYSYGWRSAGSGYETPAECPPAEPVTAYVNGVPFAKTAIARTPKPGTRPIMDLVLGRTDWRIYQGWGPTDFPGEPDYTYQGRYYPEFHMGLDLNHPDDFGDPLYAPDDGVATKVVYPSGNLVEVVTLANGYRWQLLHLSRQVAQGPVGRGQLLGYVGSTGNSSGPHLHLELQPPGGGRAWVPVEQWVCRHMAA